jgi:hypothetical protein
MPKKSTLEKAKQDLREGKAATTAAGEFVREEIDHVREGKHGARSAKQAIAIGLSKARRAGVPLKAPKKGETTAETQRSAKRAYEVGQGKRKAPAPSKRRSRAVLKALEQEPKNTVTKRELSKQTKRASKRRKKRAQSS